MTEEAAVSVARPSRARAWASALVPLVLIAAALAAFLVWGGALLRWIGTAPAPVERLVFERVVFRDTLIEAHVLNDGPDPITIASVFVNDAIWPHRVTARTLGRLGRATITIPYFWIPGEPLSITVVTGTGLTFTHEVAVAAATPQPNPGQFAALGLLGAYVGVLPVLLGLLWLPFVRSLSRQWVQFLLSLTAGLLLFLGVDTVSEGLEVAGRMPRSFQGLGLLLLGVVGSALVLNAVAHRVPRDRALPLAYMIATGIGLHNFGEGLAIGAALALGELALGTFLVVGFTLHNTTEGLAIVTPLAEERVRARDLASLGMVAGAPAIAGAWIGGFTYADPLAVLALGFGGGAIFQVVWELVKITGRGEAATRPLNVLGWILGIAVMLATGILVTA